MKTNTLKWIRLALAGLGLAGVVILTSGCAEPAGVSAGVTYSEPVYYDYYWYPHANVYYYPSGHVYYWHDGSAWRSGAHVPRQYAYHNEHREHLRLHSREPWTEHHPESH